MRLHVPNVELASLRVDPLQYDLRVSMEDGFRFLEVNFSHDERDQVDSDFEFLGFLSRYISLLHVQLSMLLIPLPNQREASRFPASGFS